MVHLTRRVVAAGLIATADLILAAAGQPVNEIHASLAMQAAAGRHDGTPIPRAACLVR